MTERPAPEDIAKWHRWFAVEANNRAWALTEQPELTAEERAEVLHAAHASAYHWSQVGTPSQVAHAHLLLGRVHALLEDRELAVRFATAAFDALTARESEAWELAFAHAVMANAAAVSGDAPRHARHHAEAERLGESLADPQDRDIFLATFRRIPAPGLAP